MEDLSHIFARMGSDPITALAPTAQAAGNQRHDNSLGMTAPGGAPASPTSGIPGAVDVHQAPVISAVDYTASPVERAPDGSHVNPDNGDRSVSYTVPDGAGWKSSAPAASPVPELGTRAMLRRGQWNTFD